MITQFAPAKVNLALHVTGQRPDGYHLLDSLVVFAGIGDRVSVSSDDTLSLEVIGADIAEVPSDARNLVLKAARLFDEDKGAKIVLEKNLPTASGIGGGSSDAAAALRALSTLWNLPLPSTDNVLRLGADLPVCMKPEPQRMRGIGEILDPAPALPRMHMVLANPRVGVTTPSVFGRMTNKINPPLEDIPANMDAAQLVHWLARQRNDLEVPAISGLPVIQDVLNALEDIPSCCLARMSGSGATCFGLFETAAQARLAEDTLRAEHQDWWVASGPMLLD